MSFRTWFCCFFVDHALFFSCVVLELLNSFSLSQNQFRFPSPFYLEISYINVPNRLPNFDLAQGQKVGLKLSHFLVYVWGCILTGGEIVLENWKGNDTAANFCNQCACLENSKLECTQNSCIEQNVLNKNEGISNSELCFFFFLNRPWFLFKILLNKLFSSRQLY